MTTPTPSEELPSDRELALQEINSLVSQVRPLLSELSSLRHLKRDRFIGWFVATLFVGVLAAATYWQYISNQDLRASLYQACLDAERKDASQKALYEAVAKVATTPESKTLLLAAAADIVPRDCGGKYRP